MIAGWEFVAQMIRQYKPKMVHSFGDVVHVTENQSVQVSTGLHMAHELVHEACQEVGALFTGHMGNHDVFNEKLRINNVRILSPYYHGLYTDPYIFKDSRLNGLRIGIIPYSSNHGRVLHYLSAFQSECDVIFGHLDVQGCRYESGIESESEIPYDFQVPLISGDIHLPQSFGGVHYVGSLVQHRFQFGDFDRAGGVLLMDMQTKKITRITNSLSLHYIKVRDENLEHALTLNRDRCLYQVVSHRGKEEIDHLFEGREYHYTPEIRPPRSEAKSYYSNFSVQEPQEVLRNWVIHDRPGALGLFDQILGEVK